MGERLSERSMVMVMVMVECEVEMGWRSSRGGGGEWFRIKIIACFKI